MHLYIKLGKRIGLTIRQLGYPTKNALKTWHGEYEQRRDLPAGYVRPRGTRKRRWNGLENTSSSMAAASRR